MAHQEKNCENPEEELESSSNPFEIPISVKIGISFFSLLLIGVCVYLVSKYLCAPKIFASPKDLGLTQIFLFSVAALIIVWVPWQRLGIRITKIGGIEFEKIVAEQASEHAEDLSYLYDRIEALEVGLRRTDEMADITEQFKEPDLRSLLVDFLTKYDTWAFPPSRIRAWGAQQQGFSALSGYEHPFIRSTLQKLVSENILETRVSKKGNTLYRIQNPNK